MADIIQLKTKLNQLKQIRASAGTKSKAATTRQVPVELLEAIVVDLDEIIFTINEHNRAIKLLMDAVTVLSIKYKSSTAHQLILDIANKTIKVQQESDME